MKDNTHPPAANGGKKALYTNRDRPPAVPPVNPAGIPAALKELARWVLWLFTWKASKDGSGKWDKVPKTVRGTNASSTDPKTWNTFEAVAAAYRTGQFSGIGFVLGDGFAGVDLDDVRDRQTGEITAGWVSELLTAAGTYSDVSPSGTGVKLFGRGSWAGDWHKRPHPSGAGEIEAYDGGRFFTVTGHTAVAVPDVADIQTTLDSLASLFDAKQRNDVPPSPPGAFGGGCSLSDDLLLERIRHSAQADKFARLWAGDTCDYGQDDSAADLALCSILAFWCGPDAGRIDRLFRRSQLMRAKWDSTRGTSTYGRWTVDKALAGKTEFYTPGAETSFRTHATTPLVSPAWPDPPAAEAFHGLAGEIVRALDPHTEADPFGVLIQLLLLFGSVVGRGPHYAVGGDRHYTNEFAVLVGPTGGGRKGTSAGMVRLVFDGTDDDWLNGRNASGVSSGEGLLWAVRDPITKRERTNNGRGCPPTFEEVEADPGVCDKRLMVQEPEFASVLKQTERQGNTASAVLRQLWDGLPVVQTLTKNSPAKATGAHVSLVGHVTPEELHRYLTATETANGFGNRFLFACVRRSKLLPDGGRVAEGVLAPLRERLVAAVTFARTVGPVPRHPSAHDLWHAVYPLLTGERAGLSGALSARAAPHVLRLALLFALLDRSPDIRLAHLLAGLAVWDYCERSVGFLFGDRTGNPVADDIRDLLRAAPDGLTRTELVSALGRHQHGDKLTAALAVLEGAGLAVREKVATGGKPAERWRATNRRAAASPLMATARRVFATCPRCDESDGSDRTPTTSSGPSSFGRNGRFDRTPGAGAAPPVWDDFDQFFQLLASRGWKWPEVLAWLKTAPTAGFFDLTTDERRRAAEHLHQLNPPSTNSSRK